MVEKYSKVSLTSRRHAKGGKASHFARRAARFNAEREILLGIKRTTSLKDLVVPYREIENLTKQTGPDGLRLEPMLVLPTPKEVFEVTQAFQRLSEEAIRNPVTLLSLTPRQFEEFIAEIWDRLGYAVELTAQTRDGGRDIIAVKDSEILLRILIECKRYTPPRAVDVSLVRALYGVKIHEQASKAVLATTSGFTGDARKLLEAHPWELEGRDLEGVLGWIHLVNSEKK